MKRSPLKRGTKKMKRSGFRDKPRKPMKRASFTQKPPSKRSKPKKRTKLPTTKKMRNKCDKLLTPIIKKQYPECFLKGAKECTYFTDVAHHHIKKSKSSPLRYNLDNLIPLCTRCHCALHANESKWVTVLIEKKGLEWSQNLLEIDRTADIKTDVHWYIEHFERLSAILND